MNVRGNVSMAVSASAAMLLAWFAVADRSAACSRVLWGDGGQGVFVGRTLDWVNPMPADLYVLPRGVKRDGLTGPDTLRWTARYGSLVAATRGGASDGMNEKGLAAHMLWLTAADFGTPKPGTPTLAVSLWAQYVLDNFASVSELVEATAAHPLNLVACEYDGLKTTVHLAVEDPSGDSAVIEYLGGKVRVHHGPEYAVMTNDPPYDEQLAGLRQYKGFGGQAPVPGGPDSASRFARAAHFLRGLPKPCSEREGVAEIVSVMRNVAQPYSVADARAFAEGRPHNSVTRWQTVADLTRKVYYYESSAGPNLVWVRLAALDFAEGTPVRKLDLVGSPGRAGDCSAEFRPSKPFEVVPPGPRP